MDGTPSQNDFNHDEASVDGTGLDYSNGDDNPEHQVDEQQVKTSLPSATNSISSRPYSQPNFLHHRAELPKTTQTSPNTTWTTTGLRPSSSRPTLLLKGRVDRPRTNQTSSQQDGGDEQIKTSRESPIPTYTTSALSTSSSPLRLWRNRSEQQPSETSEASPIATTNHSAIPSYSKQPKTSDISPLPTSTIRSSSRPNLMQNHLEGQTTTASAAPIHTRSYSAIPNSSSSSPPLRYIRYQPQRIAATSGSSVPTVTPSILPSSSSPPVILQSRVGNHFTSTSSRDRLQPTKTMPSTNGYNDDHNRYSETSSSHHDRSMSQNALKSMDSNPEMDYFNQYTSDYEPQQNGDASSHELDNLLCQLNSFTVESTGNYRNLVLYRYSIFTLW